MKKTRTLAFGIEPSNRRFRFRLARYRFLAEAVGRSLPAQRCLVLDAGCGKGRLGLYWKHLAPPGAQAQLVGFDLSRERLSLARERGYSSLLRSDLLQWWPFADASFDVVVLEQVLEHFDDARVVHLLSEVRRVLKPGGRAWIGVPVFFRPALWIAPLWRLLSPYYRRIRGTRPVGAHLQHFTLAEIRQRIERQGLLVEEARGFRLFSLPFNILEDREWYYRLHRRLAARFPGMGVEVSLSARRPD